MPLFEYQVKTSAGKSIKGKLTATDKPTAMEELRKRGLTVFSLIERKTTILSMDIYIGNPVKPLHFIIYCRQFATLMRAGVSIVDATRILAEQTESKPLRKALVDVNSSLMRGISFSQAVQDHKKIFPQLFVSMIRAGEESGDIEGTLDRLAMFFEKQHTTTEKIKSALTYPITVGVMAIAAVIYLLWAIVPQFVTMFESMDAELPAITQMVLALSKSIQGQWYFWILGVLLLVIAFQITKRTEKGAYALDYAKLKIPVFGKLNQKGSIAQFTRTFSSLYASSVPILQSLVIVEEVAGNKVIGKFIRSAGDSLRQGNPLSEPLKKAWVFPPLVTQMIAIGEETGALDTMLSKVADFYEMDVENTVDRLKSLLEPLLIAFLAAVVGVIVAAIMLPMFSLYGNM
ncbi:MULTISPECIES: type II secretion system F family protein [Paenibacillus]|jgi:type IV pilus assembly protein PilC|uniref:Type II secretion system protein F n=2 Tax=Paenibacillus odorifer TaxID=189426 RepID=A0ABX3GF98_9BACL|nr:MULTISPECIES: type II secretion system F family protein [Paenibacillus]AIQ76808.1 type II secretion system protein F [Paenibacillus odorifer]ETT65536.1 type II secretion system protein [Paenibacillus sp. FSL H8-237]MEC0133060.1 type II secretion system F family protein [Paenibacillus odorifer]MEC0223495.1 type II secretion system F family protein [Paenibacillus odorifer]OMC77596.1 type II secretion system protein F [Paenibacillus odorifer]